MGSAMARRRVLIVEDHFVSRMILASLFKKSGWEVSEGGTVAEGMAALALAPDCVVVDLLLPDGSGEEILRRIKDEQVPIPVVVVVSDP